MRMKLSDEKIISPFVFLEHAKKARLYPQMTNKMIEKSCEYFKNRDTTFSINLMIEDIKNEPLIILSKKQGEEYYHDYMESCRLDGMIPYIKKEVDDLNEYMMAISLGEGIGLTATEVINENDQVVAIPLKESHHHADYAVGYHRDNEKKAIQQFMKYVEDYFRL